MKRKDEAPAMTITYCLITQGADVHSVSTLVSALSIRRLHPTARILVLTDADSARNLRDCHHALLTIADELIIESAPDGTAALRHRFIKTRLRKRVAGDFLYLDADTVVLAPLDEVFQTTAPFAAVPNHNSAEGAMEPNFADELEIFRANQWAIHPSPYINGGVLYFRDTPETHAFCELWHQKWSEASRGGRHNDQQALNSAIWDSGITCAVLPHRFNAQIHARPRASLGASIWHIYATTPPEFGPTAHWNALIARGLASGTITAADVDRLCRKRHPWIVSNPVDALLVWSMVHRRDFLPIGAFERTWLAGRPRRACKNWVKAMLARA